MSPPVDAATTAEPATAMPPCTDPFSRTRHCGRGSPGAAGNRCCGVAPARGGRRPDSGTLATGTLASAPSPDTVTRLTASAGPSARSAR